MRALIEVAIFFGPSSSWLERIYILDLISSWRALSLSISGEVDFQRIPRPSSSLGLGICSLVNTGVIETAADMFSHHVKMNLVLC